MLVDSKPRRKVHAADGRFALEMGKGFSALVHIDLILLVSEYMLQSRIVLTRQPIGAILNPADFEQIHQMLFRIGIAAVMGGILGIDRDLHRKPAGVRVLALVCTGAAAIAMASVVAVSGSDLHPSAGVLPAIQGVLSGIGFLGAGVIMRAQGKDEVHGLTTAASVWVAAILGLICGLGQWMLALSAFGIAWAILVGGRQVEAHVLRYAPPIDLDSSKPEIAEKKVTR